METKNTTPPYQKETYKVIKPKIITSLLILKAAWYGYFYISGIGILWMSIYSDLDNSGTPFLNISNLLILLGLFLLIILVNYLIFKRTLEKTYYNFYENRIEYFDGFLIKNRKTIKFSKITDISQKKGIIERFFGLGTVGITTAGSHGNEIFMRYLDSPDDVYDWIDSITSKYER